MNEAINITAILMSVVSLIVSISALVIVLAYKLSTHKIEWKPLPQETFEPFKEVDNELTKQDSMDEELLNKAFELSRKKREKNQDPLDTILETSNF